MLFIGVCFLGFLAHILAEENLHINMDLTCRLADESLLHLEFQTTAVTRNDLQRFAGYDLKLLERYWQPIQTVVIYSGRVETAPDGFDHGSLIYQLSNVYLNRLDAEKEYRYLNEKIKRGEKLSQTEIVRLIFLPLMKHGKSEGEVALKAAELAKMIPDEKQNLVFAAIIALSDRYMTETEKKRLLEVVALTQIEQWIKEEGRREGRLEGKLEGRLETARRALQKGYSPEDVADITSLPLNKILALKREIDN